MPYTGIVDCGMKSVANEGVLMLWAGFPTYVFRIAPHVMITFIVSEFLKKGGGSVKCMIGDLGCITDTRPS